MLVVIVEEHKASSTTRLDSITYGHGRIIGMEQNYWKYIKIYYTITKILEK